MVILNTGDKDMTEQIIKSLIIKETDFISSINEIIKIENNIGCVDGQIIGTGRADYTQNSLMYELSVDGKKFALIDIPGIEGDESRFEEIIKDSLDKAHLVFYVNGSGKKIEMKTLEKIKKYMHDGTSVYAIFNVHCKPKKERILGLDKTFSEELKDAYSQTDEIIAQTEPELRSFLGNNYKGNISLNGLLSFCGLAVNNDGLTTIVDDANKTLRSDQKKYFNEYCNDLDTLLNDSGIASIQTIIKHKVRNFDKDIYDENIKKLKKRLHDMIKKIENLNDSESTKIRGFINTYDEFESNCYNAKEDYIRSIRHIGYNAALDSFSDVKDDLFQMIEKDKGKTKPEKIQQYFDENKDEIVKKIQIAINDRMTQLQNDYVSDIEDARRRLVKDCDREQTKFEIKLTADNLAIDDSFADALKYDLKTFGGDLLKVVSLAFSGFSVGNLFTPIGGVIGLCIGVILGVFSSIWGFFASEATRINHAKEKLQMAIDEQIDEISNQITNKMKELDFETKINDSYDQICFYAERQRTLLKRIISILESVESELKQNYKRLL